MADSDFLIDLSDACYSPPILTKSNKSNVMMIDLSSDSPENYISTAELEKKHASKVLSSLVTNIDINLPKKCTSPSETKISDYVRQTSTVITNVDVVQENENVSLKQRLLTKRTKRSEHSKRPIDDIDVRNSKKVCSSSTATFQSTLTSSNCQLNADNGLDLRNPSNRVMEEPSLSTDDASITSSGLKLWSIDSLNIDRDSDWEVVFLVDNREKDFPLIQANMHAANISCDVCQLTLGDFLWIARKKSIKDLDNYGNDYSSDSSASSTISQKSGSTRSNVTSKHSLHLIPEVIVLDCIIERKTGNDLADSIKDGRYEEQKQRLLTCGIKNVIYLVEGTNLTVRSDGPRMAHNKSGVAGSGFTGAPTHFVTSTALRTAVVSTQVW